MVLTHAVQPGLAKLNSNPILSTEAEARSIMSCPDINYHLSKLRQDDMISEFVETDKQ